MNPIILLPLGLAGGIAALLASSGGKKKTGTTTTPTTTTTATTATTATPTVTTATPGVASIPGVTAVPASTTPTTVTLPTGQVIPAEYFDPQLIISTAIASGNPDQMRQVATMLESNGYATAAAQLRAYADTLEAAQAAQVTPAVVTPTVVTPAVVPAAQTAQPTITISTPETPAPVQVSVPTQVTIPTVTVDPMKASSEALIAYLKGTSKGKEDQSKVSLYQTAAGLKADGKYGFGTAERVAKAGVVPLKPWYTSGATWAALVANKKEWNQKVDAWAAQDPARATEWMKAKVS